MSGKLVAVLAVGLLAAGCDRDVGLKDVPAGSDVRVETDQGVTLSGRLVEVGPDHVVLSDRGATTKIARANIRRVTRGNEPRSEGEATRSSDSAVPTTGIAPAPLDSIARMVKREPAYREVTIPAGTLLPLVLESRVASDSSRVEDAVSARLRRSIVISGATVVPAGSSVGGSVVDVRRSGKVKGRARVAMRFTNLRTPDGDETYAIRTGVISRQAPGTKRKDAAKIAIPAAGGAIIGGIAGGKKGAAIGSAVGGGAGTAVVLTTRGKEVRLGPGAAISARLVQPLTVRVPIANRPE